VKHERLNKQKDARIIAKYSKSGREPPKTLEELEKDPDLGMDFDDYEPKFDLVKDVDHLYVEKPVGKYEPSTASLARIRAKKDLTRIVKKKYKPEPQTQQEQKDCSVELTGDQLQKITAGPQKIPFGPRFVKSSTTKGFNISNDLRQNIYVRVLFDQYPELAQSSPVS